jgi:hypothetical protein
VSLISQIAQVWLRDVGSVGMLCRRWPNAAAGISITAGATPAFSAWTTLVAKSVISNPEWISAAFLEAPVDAGASEVWLVDLAQGASGAEISLSSGTITEQGLGTVTQFFKTDVGTATANMTVNLPIPLKVVGAVRISGSLAGLVTGGKAASVAFQSYSGIGT